MRGFKALAVIIFTGTFANCTLAEERCLSDAWQKFNSNNYQKAIKSADRCISKFGKEAQKQQSAVKKRPPCGIVNDQDKSLIHRRGLLNDVATAAWIKSQSATALGQTKVAETAKTLVCQEFSYGRTWDPNGWFWAPCDQSCS